MRVIAGTAGSIPLRYPSGADIRPTTDAIREYLFSSLAERVTDAVFCDVYAGAGTVGIEALSRGASSCVFLEKDRRCVQALRDNLAKTRLAELAVVLAGDAGRLYGGAAASHGPFDIVFLDPPYGLPAAEALVRAVVDERAGLAADALVIVQQGRAEPLQAAREPDRVRRFGETMLTFFDFAASDAAAR
jgi:16S rRNA (guanine966-N2)-methyltransferase